MNGLPDDVTFVAMLLLFLSAAFLLFGFMIQHRNCQPRPKASPRVDRSRPAVDRMIWEDESWEFDNDPRDLLVDDPAAQK